MTPIALALALCSGACTPTACSDEGAVIDREVDILVGEPGPGVKEAKRRLIARGRSAIAILETGLYHADAIGRVRIVAVLQELGGSDAIAVLRHIAKRDEDELVREQASLALETLGSTKR
jgi:hypothetical protein